ncbi:MAG: G5 domain-containing protein [Oscillospiraceae bacterium]|nr:G5 domain-containing protein [Oscillospiraceae bacterium]
MQLISINRNRKLTRIAAVLMVMFCLSSMLATPAFAQNTYVITDGDQVTVHTTYATNPEKVLSEAGLELGAEDSYTTQASWTGGEITVQRAQQITVSVCGEPIETASNGETVEALLERLGVIVGGDYQVSEPLDTMTYDGLALTVDHVVHQPETYTVEMPFETTYCYDPTMEEGQQRVITEGVPGQMLRKADVVYVNMQEQSRTVVEETVLQQPVNQVVAVGTGENVGGESGQVLIGDGVIVLSTGEVLTYTRTAQFVATGYSQFNEGCNDTTATGSKVRPGVVAVDPTVIPYGTRMFIVANDGSYIYGIGTAEDCGGAIQGNRVDLYFETDPECFQFGVRNCTIYFLGDANWR